MMPFMNSRNIQDSPPEINKESRMSLDIFPFVIQGNSPKSSPVGKTYSSLLGIFRFLLLCLETTFWPVLPLSPPSSEILRDSLG